MVPFLKKPQKINKHQNDELLIVIFHICPNRVKNPDVRIRLAAHPVDLGVCTAIAARIWALAPGGRLRLDSERSWVQIYGVSSLWVFKIGHLFLHLQAKPPARQHKQLRGGFSFAPSISSNGAPDQQIPLRWRKWVYFILQTEESWLQTQPWFWLLSLYIFSGSHTQTQHCTSSFMRTFINIMHSLAPTSNPITLTEPFL